VLVVLVVVVLVVVVVVVVTKTTTTQQASTSSDTYVHFEQLHIIRSMKAVFLHNKDAYNLQTTVVNQVKENEKGEPNHFGNWDRWEDDTKMHLI
jgi:hypothetical protein